jgi:lysophospholipase L1-like esterase
LSVFKTKRLHNALLLLGSIVVGLSILEVSLVFALRHPSILASMTADGAALPAFKQYYLDADRKIAQFLPDCAEYDPTLGYRLKSGECRFVNREFDTKYRISRDGFRDDTDPSTASVVVTGDSFAMGWGVEQNETFAEMLQERLKQPVLNAAVSSYGTARELLRLRQLLLNPSAAVVIAYNRNDFVENRTFLSGGDQLEIMSAKAYAGIVSEHAETTEYYIFKHLHLLTMNAWASWNAPPPARLGQPSSLIEAQTFLNVLKRFPDVLAGRRVVIVDTEEYLARDNNFIESLALLLSYSDQLPFPMQIQLVDPGRVLKAADYFQLDTHFNASGHVKVANLLEDALRRAPSHRLAPRILDFKTVGTNGSIEGARIGGKNVVFRARVDHALTRENRVFLYLDDRLIAASEIPTQMANAAVGDLFEIKVPRHLVRDARHRRFVGRRSGSSFYNVGVADGVFETLDRSFAPEKWYSLKDDWVVDRKGRPLKHGGAKAYIDQIGPLSALGWAVATKDGEPAVAVIVVLDDTPIAYVELTLPRNDVAKALKNKSATKSGFSVAIPRELDASDRKKLRFFAILKNGEAAEFGFRGVISKAAPTPKAAPVPQAALPTKALPDTPSKAPAGTAAFSIFKDRLKHGDTEIYAPATGATGWIDLVRISAKGVQVDGWAADPATKAAPTEILIFVNDVLAAQMKPNVDRPDVSQALNAPSLKTSGFSAALPAGAYKSGVSLRVFAIFEGRRAVVLTLSERAAAALR